PSVVANDTEEGNSSRSLSTLKNLGSREKPDGAAGHCYELLFSLRRSVWSSARAKRKELYKHNFLFRAMRPVRWKPCSRGPSRPTGTNLGLSGPRKHVCDDPPVCVGAKASTVRRMFSCTVTPSASVTLMSMVAVPHFDCMKMKVSLGSERSS